MGLSVVFVSGLRSAGKSAVVQLVADKVCQCEPHYLRLASQETDKRPPIPSAKNPRPRRGIASARWLNYTPDHVIEILADALTDIHKQDRYGLVVIEADSDAALRYAYPYDHRIFVMPIPHSPEEVFRNPAKAAVELQRVLDDTAMFAAEIFGLIQDDGANDVDPKEERSDLTETQMRGFLYSPLGDELATRIQLEPPYHGLVESDVVLVNTGVGDASPRSKECLRKIERLLSRTRGLSGRDSKMLLFNPRDPKGKVSKKLLQALKPMCQGGK